MTKARSSADFAAGGPSVAGKNAIINGGMDIWQRGTSFTPNTTIYMADRWEMYVGATGTTVTRQTTSDTTNLPFIQYCMRVSRDSGNSGTNVRYLYQPMETVNSIPLASKTVTFSFYARRGATFSGSVVAKAGTGTGTDQNPLVTYTGAASPISSTPTLTTTWQRFTYTGTFAASATEVYVGFEWTPSGTAGATDYFEVTGVQIEVGSTATPFSRAGGTIQGELAACQRYYYLLASENLSTIGVGYMDNSTTLGCIVNFPVTMRGLPSLVATTGTDYYIFSRNGGTDTFNSLTVTGYSGKNNYVIFNNTQISGTAGQSGAVACNNALASVAFSAEL